MVGVWLYCRAVCRQVTAAVSDHDRPPSCSRSSCHIISNKSHARSSWVVHGLPTCAISSPRFSPQCMMWLSVILELMVVVIRKGPCSPSAFQDSPLLPAWQGEYCIIRCDNGEWVKNVLKDTDKQMLDEMPDNSKSITSFTVPIISDSSVSLKDVSSRDGRSVSRNSSITSYSTSLWSYLRMSFQIICFCHDP